MSRQKFFKIKLQKNLKQILLYAYIFINYKKHKNISIYNTD